MITALVVEDAPLNMELVIEILDAAGIDTDKAVDGEEAIAKAGERVYDLILMDIALPGMDGVEATRIIKSMPEYEDVPVIALTAFAMKGDKERLLGAGFDDYISKPIEVSDFMKKIQKYRK